MVHDGGCRSADASALLNPSERHWQAGDSDSIARIGDSVLFRHTVPVSPSSLRISPIDRRRTKRRSTGEGCVEGLRKEGCDLPGGEHLRADEGSGSLQPRMLLGRDGDDLDVGGRRGERPLGEPAADGRLDQVPRTVISPPIQIRSGSNALTMDARPRPR